MVFPQFQQLMDFPVFSVLENEYMFLHIQDEAL
jgi:hypothetical protein